jgi:hypothetical protein
MYGYEAATGLGGLMAQAPTNPYMGRALTIRAPGSMVIGDQSIPDGQVLPYQLSRGPSGGPVSISAGGGAVTQNPANQLGSWREILDWHNSPAPWVLLLLLFVYGYVHVSYKRGRVNAGGGV